MEKRAFIWKIVGLSEIVLGVLNFGFSAYLFSFPSGIIWGTFFLPLGIFFMLTGILLVKYVSAAQIISLAAVMLLFISSLGAIIIQILLFLKHKK